MENCIYCNGTGFGYPCKGCGKIKVHVVHTDATAPVSEPANPEHMEKDAAKVEVTDQAHFVKKDEQFIKWSNGQPYLDMTLSSAITESKEEFLKYLKSEEFQKAWQSMEILPLTNLPESTVEEYKKRLEDTIFKSLGLPEHMLASYKTKGGQMTDKLKESKDNPLLVGMKVAIPNIPFEPVDSQADFWKVHNREMAKALDKELLEFVDKPVDAKVGNNLHQVFARQSGKTSDLLDAMEKAVEAAGMRNALATEHAIEQGIISGDKSVEVPCTYCLDTGTRHNGYYSYPCSCQSSLVKMQIDLSYINKLTETGVTKMEEKKQCGVCKDGGVVYESEDTVAYCKCEAGQKFADEQERAKASSAQGVGVIAEKVPEAKSITMALLNYAYYKTVHEDEVINILDTMSLETDGSPIRVYLYWSLTYKKYGIIEKKRLEEDTLLVVDKKQLEEIFGDLVDREKVVSVIVKRFKPITEEEAYAFLTGKEK